jgi:hypothetical protein
LPARGQARKAALPIAPLARLIREPRDAVAISILSKYFLDIPAFPPHPGWRSSMRRDAAQARGQDKAQSAVKGARKGRGRAGFPGNSVFPNFFGDKPLKSHNSAKQKFGNANFCES